MSLIDRYIYATTKSMSPGVREDVAKELRATIEDALEEKGSRSKRHIHEVLLALGDPTLLAQQYKDTKNYLIGPDAYRPYLKILRLALSIGLPIAFVVNFATSFTNESENLIKIIGFSLGNTITAGIEILFWVTLAFFIMERSGVRSRDLQEDGSPWTPEKLPQVPEKREIPLGDSITSLATYALLTATPFIAPSIFGASIDGNRIPFFAPQLWSQWTLVIVATGGLGILLTIWKLMAKRWTTGVVAFNTLYALALSAGLVALLFTTPIVNEEFIRSVAESTKDITAEELRQILSWSVAVSIAVTIGIYLYDAGKAMWTIKKR